MSTKPRTRKGSKTRQRRGATVFFWHLQDAVFFQRHDELSDSQKSLYIHLRKMWAHRGGIGIVTEESKVAPEFAAEVKDLRVLFDLGVIIREDALAMARRIKAEYPAGGVRATN